MNNLSFDDVNRLRENSKIQNKNEYDKYSTLFEEMLLQCQDAFIDYSIKKFNIYNAEKPVVSDAVLSDDYTFIAELDRNKIIELAKCRVNDKKQIQTFATKSIHIKRKSYWETYNKNLKYLSVEPNKSSNFSIVGGR